MVYTKSRRVQIKEIFFKLKKSIIIEINMFLKLLYMYLPLVNFFFFYGKVSIFMPGLLNVKIIQQTLLSYLCFIIEKIF
jgi:hypothetical protein